MNKGFSGFKEQKIILRKNDKFEIICASPIRGLVARSTVKLRSVSVSGRLDKEPHCDSFLASISLLYLLAFGKVFFDR